MKRSSVISWEQLRVGAVILIALVIVGIAILRLGEAASLFSRRYTLVSFVSNTAGLREGGQVTVAGQLVGSVKSIEFLPVDADTNRNLRITVEIDRRMQPQIRRDSEAKLRSQGLLGDKVFDISPGTPRFAALAPGDTIRMGEAADYESVLAQASGALDQVVLLTGSLQKVADGAASGQGTLGQMLTNRSLYDNLNTTLARTSALMVRLQNPSGTVGQLLNDPALYNNLSRVLASADTVMTQLGAGIGRGEGTVSKLLNDDELYERLVSAVANVDTLASGMARGSGTMSKLFNEDELYDQLLAAVTSLNTVLTDVRRDPRRYTRGLIRVF